jgi:hypothetical protein
MPGMMRSRSTGCTCCGDWVADRAREKREWERLADAEIERWRGALDLMSRWPTEEP